MEEEEKAEEDGDDDDFIPHPSLPKGISKWFTITYHYSPHNKNLCNRWS